MLTITPPLPPYFAANRRTAWPATRKGADHVYIKNTAQAGVADFLKAGGGIDNACVIEQCIHAVEIAVKIGKHCRDLLWICHITAVDFTALAGGRNIRRHRIGTGLVRVIGQRHVIAIDRRQPRHSGPDAS